MVSNHVKFMNPKPHLTSSCHLRKTVASINLRGNLVGTCSSFVKEKTLNSNNIKIAKETEGTLATNLNTENTSNKQSVHSNEMYNEMRKKSVHP